MADGLPHTLCSQGMQTTWRRCVQKAWCWTFRQKVVWRHYQVCVKKLNANEPLMTCRKRNLAGKTVGFIALTGQTVADNCLLATDQPALRRQELYTGFYTKRERLNCWCANQALQEVFFWSDCSINILQFKLQLNLVLDERSNRKRRTEP